MSANGARQGAAAIGAGTDHRSAALGRLLNARELADMLGFAAGTIVDWAERDELPSFKIGGRLRFKLSEVDVWLEERRQ